MARLEELMRTVYASSRKPKNMDDEIDKIVRDSYNVKDDAVGHMPNTTKGGIRKTGDKNMLKYERYSPEMVKAVNAWWSGKNKR